MKRFTFEMLYDKDEFEFLQSAIESVISSGATWAKEFKFEMKEVIDDVRSENADNRS